MSWARAAAVTKHDTNPNRFAALYVGTGGDVTVRPRDSASDVTFVVPSGGYVLVQVDLVKATGTDAEDIVGLN